MALSPSRGRPYQHETMQRYHDRHRRQTATRDMYRRSTRAHSRSPRHMETNHHPECSLRSHLQRYPHLGRPVLAKSTRYSIEYSMPCRSRLGRRAIARSTLRSEIELVQASRGPSFLQIGMPHFAPRNLPTLEHSRPRYTVRVRLASSMPFHPTKHSSCYIVGYTSASISFDVWETLREMFLTVSPKAVLTIANIAKLRM